MCFVNCWTAHLIRCNCNAILTESDRVLPGAELERGLIVERVRAGLPNARSKGKKLGRPKKVMDPARVVGLRSQGLPWRAIASQLGVVGLATLHRASVPRSKTQERDFGTR